MTQVNDPATAASGLMRAHDEVTPADSPIRKEWLCTNRHRLQLWPRLARLAHGLSEALGKLLGSRMAKSTWVRYTVCLDQYNTTIATVPPPPEDVKLERIDEAIMAELRAHPLRERNQLKSAFQFWQHGLRNAFIWREDGQPLCFLWLFLPQHNELLRRLPGWSGMYPPLSPGWGQFENTFTFPRGLRRAGGAATDFAQAVMYDARERRLCGLITHIHHDNLMARRWAQRTGCQAYGTITRYHIDLPLLRSFPWYIHRLGEVPPITSLRERAGRQGLPKNTLNTQDGQP